MDSILDKKPRETAGRETVNRFRMQFQAAAFAALEILSGKDVDRVYCDYHDDFVVRRKIFGSLRGGQISNGKLTKYILLRKKANLILLKN